MVSTETDVTQNEKISTTEITLPKGGGAIRGIGETFKADSFSGTGSYSISFPVTPARGLQPDITLRYNSGSGNSEFGLGFSLSLSKISTRTDKGIPKYDGTDLYLLPDGSELVKQQSTVKNKNPRTDGKFSITTYLPRVATDYSKIEQWLNTIDGNTHWKIVTKDNIIHVFGNSDLSRIANPNNKLHVFEWLISESMDPKGNIIQYAYKAENENTINKAAVPAKRSFDANRYIQSIRYGNYIDQNQSHYAFEVAFDYGEYSFDNISKVYMPAGDMKDRPDPFSSFKSGFEIRTCRLCRNILLFHHFKKELGDDGYLVKSMSLDYSAAQYYENVKLPLLSRLIKVEIIGYRKNDSGKFIEQCMPPVELHYSNFMSPSIREFKKLSAGDAGIPGYLNDSSFLPIDLNGDGLPGFLYSNQTTTIYMEPLGNGKYGSPGTMSSFPISRDLQQGGISLTDIDGNGQLELVVQSDFIAGYYSNNEDGKWGSFCSFLNYPTDITNSRIETADLSGNGKKDLLLAGVESLKVYFSKGKAGYGSAEKVTNENGFPLTKVGDEKELVAFADMFGDGLPHRVRIRNGSVDCWPCLGYGRYGTKISLSNAPVFDHDFDINRLFLADIDGTGVSDLVYVYSDSVEIFFNQSGNSFTGPLRLRLPDCYSQIDQISFLDIHGNGTSCLVFTKIASAPIHYYYDFVGETVYRDGARQSTKPYLLTEVDNSMGLLTQIHYCSSTKFALEDKKNGRPWLTKLRFPVQVVEKVTILDFISQSRFVNSYCYHDGYYDPVERVFCGFGFVESWDTETFEAFEKSRSNPDFPVERMNAELYVPPVYTKSWYHTGAVFSGTIKSRHYCNYYFKGDPDAHDFPDSVFTLGNFENDSEIVRQACFALKGQLMRTEVYANDNKPESVNPYTVKESNAEVVLVQSRGEQLYAVFVVNPLESIHYQYERNPFDPRVQQGFTLEVDPVCGEVSKACSIYLPRRKDSSRTPKATALHSSFVNTTEKDDFYYRAMSCETQEFELFGLELKGKKYFSCDDIKKPVLSALASPLPYEAPLQTEKLPVTTKIVQARQLTWSRNFFWNKDQSDALAIGQTGPCGLLHHRENAVFTKDFITDVFGKTLTNEILHSKGGYLFGSEKSKISNRPVEIEPVVSREDLYYWNKGLTEVYHGPDQPDHFYMLKWTENSFADPSSSLYSKTELNYKMPYCFSAEQVIQYIDESAGEKNVVAAEMDYATMQIRQITDINGTVSQALFDPLGQVVVTTLFGYEFGTGVGGMLLYPYNGKAAEYQLPEDPSFSKICAKPSDYLHGATTYFYYNLLAWSASKQPFSSIELTRENFYCNTDGLTSDAARIVINYSDGFGRTLETKKKTEPGIAIIHDDKGQLILDNNHQPVEAVSPERWIVSGRVVYDNKGNPSEQYLPYFTNVPVFESQKEIVDQKLVPPPSITHYDPLSRLIRVDTPKGFFSKTEFTPWETWHYDENDTILDSTYYNEFFKKGTQPPEEKEALIKAAKFYNTPSITFLNNVGQKIYEIENNLGNVMADDFNDIVRGTGIKPQALFEELISKGYLATSNIAPKGTWVTAKFQPYERGFQLKLDTPYLQFAQQVIVLLKQNGLISLCISDIQARVQIEIDPRLYYANQTTGTAYFNFEYRYAMGAKEPMVVNSADAGVKRHLNNIFDKQLVSLSARNYCQLIEYDRLQRQVSLQIKKIKPDEVLTSFGDFNLVELFEYGDANTAPKTGNLRGQVYKRKDLSGVVTNSEFSVQGTILQSSSQMVADYKTPVDWKKSPRLDPGSYPFTFSYNAFNQVTTEKTPDGSITANSYSIAGLLTGISVKFQGNPIPQIIIKQIDYDAKGQRSSLQYGNGIHTNYTYEDTTLRLTWLESTRVINGVIEKLQDIVYTYDPVGNIACTRDTSIETVFNKNQQIDPSLRFTYDALYRLIEAKGRQHESITVNTFKNNQSQNSFKQCVFSNLSSANDGKKLVNYEERYSYDDAGNLLATKHKAVNAPPAASWTRETSVLDNSNRLKDYTDFENSNLFDYDASGNQQNITINNSVRLSYNCCEHLVRATVIERPAPDNDDSVYFVYDASGQRTRKVCERMAHGGNVIQVEEKIYVSNYEEQRRRGVNAKGGLAIGESRQTLRIMDGSTCVAIIYYAEQGSQRAKRNAVSNREIRFQLDNHLGSVAMEMDTTAQLISYEEYLPYGGTAIIAGKNQKEVAPKQYRYSGKECDDSTGFYYYGARYYVPWIGRWLNPDPAGTVDGLNLFTFVKGNPVKNRDGDGRRILRRLFSVTPRDLFSPPTHTVFSGQAAVIRPGEKAIVSTPSLVYCRALAIQIPNEGIAVIHYEGRNEAEIVGQIKRDIPGFQQRGIKLLRLQSGPDVSTPSIHSRPGMQMDVLLANFLDEFLQKDLSVQISAAQAISDKETEDFHAEFDKRSLPVRMWDSMAANRNAFFKISEEGIISSVNLTPGLEERLKRNHE